MGAVAACFEIGDGNVTQDEWVAYWSRIVEESGWETVDQQLSGLVKQLDDGILRPANDDDAIQVLRTVAVYFKGVPSLMDKTLEAMDALDAMDRTKVAGLSSQFEKQVLILEEAARKRDSSQVDACRAAGRCRTVA